MKIWSTVKKMRILLPTVCLLTTMLGSIFFENVTYAKNEKPNKQIDKYMKKYNVPKVVTKDMLDAINNNIDNEDNQEDGTEFKTDRYIIKFKDDKGRQKLESKLDNKVKGYEKINGNKKGLDNAGILTIKGRVKPKDILMEIRYKGLEDEVEYIQPDYKLKIYSGNKQTVTDAVYSDSNQYKDLSLTQKQVNLVYGKENPKLNVSDPYFCKQWGLFNQDNINQEYRIDANVVPAWEEANGEGIVVAIIDTGIDITHEDLKANVWRNENEVPENGKDDDGNGYIDDVYGWNFCEDSYEIHRDYLSEGEWHGTQIAGIIAAEKDNKGIAGIAPEAKIMPLKVFENGTAYTSDIINAIEYASKMGAKIVNCSWGSMEDNFALEEAINGSDMLFICAAGNGGISIDSTPVYPASYNYDNIITVASIGEKGLLSNFSNFGQTIDVTAPGENIFSTVPDGGFGYGTGTSFSAAFVTGEAVLILSKNKDMSSEILKNTINNSCDILSSLAGKAGTNKINVYNAINQIFDNDTICIDDGLLGDYSLKSGQSEGYSLFSIPNQVHNVNVESTSNSITVTWDSIPGITEYEIEADNNIINVGAGISYVHSGLQQSSQHTYRVRGKNESGAGAWSEIIFKRTNAAVTLKSVYDTYGYWGGAGNVGSQTTMKVANYYTYWSHLKFDLSTIPKDAIVKHVKVRLYMESDGNSTNRNYLKRCNDSYYDNFTESSNYSWSSHWPSSTTIDDILVGNTEGWKEFSSIAVINTIANWINQSVPNRGFMVAPHQQSDDTGSGRYYRTKEYGDSYAPQLVIEYEDPWVIRTSATESSITVMWEGVSSADGYEIEADGQIISIGNNVEYIHQNLAPNTQHTYRVRAVYNNQPGDWSSTINAATTISKVRNVTTEPTSFNITVEWDNLTGADRYELDVDGEIISNGISNIYLHGGLEKNSIHTYRVRAICGDQYGEWSDAVAETTNNNTVIALNPIFDTYGQSWEVSGHGSETTFQVCNVSTFMGVLKFDLSSIPSNANIIAAGLRVYMEEQNSGTISHMNRLNRFNDPYYDSYLENSVYKWLEHWPSVTYLQEITVGKDAGWKEWSNTSLTNTVVSWVDGGITNRGFILGTTSTACDYAKRYYRSREYSYEFAPKLVVEYEPLPPETPTSIFVTTPSYSSITLIWGEVAGATEYDVEVDGTVINVGNRLSYTHDNLMYGTQHSYRVRAKNTCGSGTWSDVVSSYTLIPAPQNINFTPNNTSITVNWDAVANVDSYEIEIDGVVSNIGIRLSYENTGLLPDTEHSYRIRGVNNNIIGEWSETVVGRTRLGAIQNVTAEGISHNTIEISWNGLLNADGYEIEIDGVMVRGVGNVLSYKNTGLIANTEHSYRVRGFNSNGQGEWSQTVVGKTKDNLMETHVDIQQNQKFNLIIAADNAESGSINYFVEYENTKIQVVDLCNSTSQIELNTPFSIGNLEVLNHQNTGEVGIIEFRIQFVLDQGKTWSGIVNGINFTGLLDGETTIKTYYIK